MVVLPANLTVNLYVSLVFLKNGEADALILTLSPTCVAPEFLLVVKPLKNTSL